MSSEAPDDDRTIVKPSALARSLNAESVLATPAAQSVPEPAGLSAAAPKLAVTVDNALPIGTRLGEFELVGVLGEGGFGIVYTAQDHSLQRRVALKEYMPSSLAQRDGKSQVHVRSERYRETFEVGLKSFVNEARLLASFDHPSLVKVYRFWEANGTAYMVMPLYEGTTLKEAVKAMPTPPDEAWLLGMLAPLTEALAVIHAENCFHRDIAPDNIILLAGSERPLLLDFGAARRVISDMTQALTVILKPGYAPVEQYAEVPEMKQGPWTDIYALAATVHWAVTGRTPPASVGRLMNDGYQPLAVAAAGRYSAGFLAALDRALGVRPEARTQSVAALRADLGLPPVQVGAGPGDGGATRSAVPGGRPAPPAGPAARRGKGPLIAVALAIVVAGTAAAWLLTRAPTAQPVAAKPPTVAAAPAVAPPPAASGAAPVAAPVAARGFEIRDEFDKVLAGGAADFKVSAQPVQKTLRIGRDKLAFNVTSSRDGFVQVLVLGPDGGLLLLFPNAQASDNRIRAGQTLKLPQASWLLDTAEPAGREDFLVVVSAQPRDYSDLGRERDYIFLKLPTGQRGADAAAAWTRSTPLLLGGLKTCPSADCEAYGAAAFSVDIEH